MDIKFPKHKKNFKKGGPTTSPDFFWHILLFMAFIIILSSAVFGSLFFIQINKESVFQVETSNGKSQIINKERIDKVLSYFSERLKKSNEIITSPPPVVDPSL